MAVRTRDNTRSNEGEVDPGALSARLRHVEAQQRRGVDLATHPEVRGTVTWRPFISHM